MTIVLKMVKFAASFVLVIVAASVPDMAASTEGPRAGATALDDAENGRPSWDGSRQLPGNMRIGARPEIFAIVAGVTCNYRYIVRNGKRVKEKYCEDTR